MGVASVSSNSYSTYMPQGGRDNEIVFLEKQKMQLQDQIQKVNQSKLDAKAKNEKVKQINEQIEQIDIQIQQKRLEKMRASAGSNEAVTQNSNQSSINNQDSINNQNSGTRTEDYNSNVNSKYMLSAASTYSELKTLGRVRTDLKNRLRTATSSGENPEAGKDIQERLNNIEGSIQKKSQKIGKDLKKAAETGEKAKRRENINDAEETEKAAEGDSAPNGSIVTADEAKKDESTKKIDNDSKAGSQKGKAVDVRI
ncbi:MAG TPA: hypothetical protein VHT34_13115 [Clostridia bacterium]|nr:hypothetical protein [Clostridia bacterium]